MGINTADNMGLGSLFVHLFKSLYFILFLLFIFMGRMNFPFLLGLLLSAVMVTGRAIKRKDARDADVRKNNAPSSDLQNDDARNIDDDDPHNEDVRRSNGDMRLEKEERWDKDFLKLLEEFASVEKRQDNENFASHTRTIQEATPRRQDGIVKECPIFCVVPGFFCGLCAFIDATDTNY